MFANYTCRKKNHNSHVDTCLYWIFKTQFRKLRCNLIVEIWQRNIFSFSNLWVFKNEIILENTLFIFYEWIYTKHSTAICECTITFYLFRHKWARNSFLFFLQINIKIKLFLFLLLFAIFVFFFFFLAYINF